MKIENLERAQKLVDRIKGYKETIAKLRDEKLFEPTTFNLGRVMANRDIAPERYEADIRIFDEELRNALIQSSIKHLSAQLAEMEAELKEL